MFPQTKIDARRLSVAFLTLLMLLTWAPATAQTGSKEPEEPTWKDEDWEDEAEDTGRSFLYKEVVLATGFSSGSTDRIELSQRPPGSYIALDYVRTFTPASPVNQKLPKWLQLSAVDLHPRLVYYSEIDDEDMEMDGIDWPMPEGDQVDFAPQDFWVRFQLAGNDRFSLRLGQIALPYGVNPLMAPRQTFILPLEEIDMGLKWDWGIGLKGPLGKLDWELAMTAGTGEAWHSRTELGGGESTSRLLTGRVGTPTYWDGQYGLSFLVGNLPHLHGPYLVTNFAESRWRVSLDGLYKRGTYLMFGGQMTYGEDGYDGDHEHVVATSGQDVAEVVGYRAWVDWVTPVANDLRISAQYEHLTRARGVPLTTDSALTLEVGYSFSTAMSLKIDYRAEMENSMEEEENAFYLTFIFYSR